MLTKAAIKEMIIPSMMPVLAPIVLFVIILPIAGKSAAFSAVIISTAAAPSGGLAPRAELVVPGALAASAAEPADSNVHLAVVRFVPPVGSRSRVFDLYMTPEGSDPIFGLDSPEYVGSFAFFGHGHTEETGFTVAIDPVLDRLTEAGLLTEGAQISFSLVEAGTNADVPATIETSGNLQSVDVHVLSDG